ncbi:hypothetical protein M125_5389 [Bacteroides fragilis str. 3998T(B)3]|uniref:Uncharacterized protein n=1 Tax=Bacteroides fragilis str. 3998T(B)3 TaxID=1339316 RepID=A0A015UY87_BACFG|nr:hypothetical protein M125_5389 [Bacteroides fragilis str. 3998T(B)3]
MNNCFSNFHKIVYLKLCLQKYEIILIIEYNSLYLHYKITSKNEIE